MRCERDGRERRQEGMKEGKKSKSTAISKIINMLWDRNINVMRL